jgi:Peroxiredoxin
MKMKLLLTALTSLIGTAVFAADAPPVGSAAPDFSLPDANGKTHSLSQYKGKYVVLEWFNPQCPFVKKHYGSSNMQNLQKEFTGQRRCLADHRFQRARHRRKSDAGRSAKDRDLVEDA